MVGAVIAAHGAAGWGLMQVQEVHALMGSAQPLLVSWIAPPTVPVATATLPQPPVHSTPRPPAMTIAAAPTPAPAPTLLASPPEPVQAPARDEPTPAPAAPTVQAPAPPKHIPASAVQYLEPPAPDYPHASRRLREAGRVLVRVYIDEAGLPRSVQMEQSSSHARLDDAAVVAVRHARFKPYTENGRPTAGWALIPLLFDLER
jgi:protein TonB